MQTISASELHSFLLTEACAHTRTWLRALRPSPARTELLDLLRRAERMIPVVGKNAGVARQACELLETIEMPGDEVRGIVQFPGMLWPKEFGRNPWEYPDDWPRMKEDDVWIRWARWNLRRDSFHVLTNRIDWILRAIARFDEGWPSELDCFVAGASGYRWRHSLARQIVVPDIGSVRTLRACRASGQKPDGYEVNDFAIRPSTVVGWIHIENDDGVTHDAPTLFHMQTIAWNQGYRGIFFAQRSNGSDSVVEICRPQSDMRLFHWNAQDDWLAERHTIALSAR